jgi:transposase
MLINGILKINGGDSMARPKKYAINLNDSERKILKKAIKDKSTSRTVLKRCQILLEMDGGTELTLEQLAHSYAVCKMTISNIIQVYINDGIDAIAKFNRNPNSNAMLKADGRAEAKLIQIACSPAPDGRARWTIRLLEEKARVELETPISRETIRRVLKKTNLDLTSETIGAFQKKKMPNL